MTEDEAREIADIAVDCLAVAASFQLRAALGELLDMAEACIASGAMASDAELMRTIRIGRALLGLGVTTACACGIKCKLERGLPLDSGEHCAEKACGGK